MNPWLKLIETVVCLRLTAPARKALYRGDWDTVVAEWKTLFAAAATVLPLVAIHPAVDSYCTP
ncbi:MAG TPA: hypothetical protein GXX57_09210 [Firmicutes bacterium]|nr:hypothetical protein [Bacillota bacterium]